MVVIKPSITRKGVAFAKRVHIKALTQAMAAARNAINRLDKEIDLAARAVEAARQHADHTRDVNGAAIADYCHDIVSLSKEVTANADA